MQRVCDGTLAPDPRSAPAPLLLGTRNAAIVFAQAAFPSDAVIAFDTVDEQTSAASLTVAL